jgi:hypothetical protein
MPATDNLHREFVISIGEKYQEWEGVLTTQFFASSMKNPLLQFFGLFYHLYEVIRRRRFAG